MKNKTFIALLTALFFAVIGGAIARDCVHDRTHTIVNLDAGAAGASAPSSKTHAPIMGALLSSTSPRVLTLPSFGCVCNGSVDDSTCMTNATAALGQAAAVGNAALDIGAGGTCVITAGAPYTIPAGATIFGHGSGTSALKSTNNGAVLIAGGQGTTFKDFAIIGSSSAASQVCLQDGAPGGTPVGYEDIRIEGMKFTTCGQAGVLLNAYTQSVSNTLGALISNVKFVSNPTYGLWINGGYESVTNIEVYTQAGLATCGEGIRIGNTGNAIIDGGEVTGCTTGVHLIGGGNDSHGHITLEINHNATNFLADNVPANGEPLVGCNMYSGDISLVSSHGIHFIGGQYDEGNYYFDGSIGTVWDGAVFPNSCCTNTIHNSFNAHASTTWWLPNNTDLNGAYPTWIRSGDDGATWTPAFGGSGLLSVGGGSSVYRAAIGPQVGATTSGGALYILPSGTSPSNTNYTVWGDGTNAYMNAPQGTGHVRAFVANNQVLDINALTSWTIGYSDSRMAGTLLGSLTVSSRSASGTFTIDSGSVQDKQIVFTASGTLNLPTPTAGREIEVIVAFDPSSGGLTFHRHGAESINGTAADLSLSSATFKNTIEFIRNDGTNWWIRAAVN